jgi:hypothetical protein
MDDTHLSQVELSIVLVGHALDLDKRGVGTRVALSALVAENAALGVQSVSGWSAYIHIHTPGCPSITPSTVIQPHAHSCVCVERVRTLLNPFFAS